MNNKDLEKVINGIITVNKNLEDSVKIGHSYFCKPMDKEDISMTVRYNLIPYIEQCYKKDYCKDIKVIKILEDSIKDF